MERAALVFLLGYLLIQAINTNRTTEAPTLDFVYPNEANKKINGTRKDNSEGAVTEISNEYKTSDGNAKKFANMEIDTRDIIVGVSRCPEGSKPDIGGTCRKILKPTLPKLTTDSVYPNEADKKMNGTRINDSEGAVTRISDENETSDRNAKETSNMKIDARNMIVGVSRCCEGQKPDIGGKFGKF